MIRNLLYRNRNNSFNTFRFKKCIKIKQDNYELNQNEKLKQDISRLEKSARQTADWSNKVEATKSHLDKSMGIDRGFIGHKSAKMMKSSKVMEQRLERAIDEKSELLKNIDRMDKLKIIPIDSVRNPLVSLNKVQVVYDNKCIFNPLKEIIFMSIKSINTFDEYIF